MRLDIYLHDSDTGATLRRLEDFLQTLEQKIMATLDDLTAAVARNGDVTQSAITLLQGLKGQLDAAIASGDPAQLQALSDQLGSQDQALADAVTANTPAASPPPPPTAP